MIVKKEKMDLALEMFEGLNVQITLGTRVFGSVIDTPETCDKILDGKSAEQKKLLSVVYKRAYDTSRAGRTRLTRIIPNQNHNIHHTHHTPGIIIN